MENQFSLSDDSSPLATDGEPVFLLKRPRAGSLAPPGGDNLWFQSAEVPAGVPTVPAMAFVPHLADVPIVPSARRARRITARVIGLLAIIGSILFLVHVGTRTSGRTELLRWSTMGQSHFHAR